MAAALVVAVAAGIAVSAAAPGDISRRSRRRRHRRQRQAGPGPQAAGFRSQRRREAGRAEDVRRGGGDADHRRVASDRAAARRQRRRSGQHACDSDDRAYVRRPHGAARRVQRRPPEQPARRGVRRSAGSAAADLRVPVGRAAVLRPGDRRERAARRSRRSSRTLEPIEHRRKAIVCIGVPEVCSISEPSGPHEPPLAILGGHRCGAMGRANTSLYSLEPNGAIAARRATGNPIADATGGEVFINTPSSLGRSTSSAGTRATTICSATGRSRPTSELHAVEVKVNRRGAHGARAPRARRVVVRPYPERPVVGVGAVVLDGDRVLLIKRGHAPLKGQWSLPGGGVEIGRDARAGDRARSARGNRTDDRGRADRRGARSHQPRRRRPRRTSLRASSTSSAGRAAVMLRSASDAEDAAWVALADLAAVRSRGRYGQRHSEGGRRAGSTPAIGRSRGLVTAIRSE